MFAIINQNVSRTVIGTVGTAIFASICLLAATSPAAAGPVADAPRATSVRYSDLNLATTQGRDTLSSRIRGAARSVCSTGSSDIRSRSEEARCTRSAVEGAHAKLAPLSFASTN